MTKEEEILNKHVSLYFSSHHDKSRWNGEGEHGGAEWHTNKAIAEDIYKAMREYAMQQAVEFFKWNAKSISEYLDYLNRVHNSEGIEEMELELNHFENNSIAGRYELFIEHQSQPE